MNRPEYRSELTFQWGGLDSNAGGCICKAADDVAAPAPQHGDGPDVAHLGAVSM